MSVLVSPQRARVSEFGLPRGLRDGGENTGKYIRGTSEGTGSSDGFKGTKSMEGISGGRPKGSSASWWVSLGSKCLEGIPALPLHVACYCSPGYLRLKRDPVNSDRLVEGSLKSTKDRGVSGDPTDNMGAGTENAGIRMYVCL